MFFSFILRMEKANDCKFLMLMMIMLWYEICFRSAPIENRYPKLKKKKTGPFSGGAGLKRNYPNLVGNINNISQELMIN